MSALKPIPDGAATTLPTLSQKAACEAYSVSKHTIRRWCEQLGVTTKPMTTEDYARNGGMHAARHGHVMPDDTSGIVTCTGCGLDRPVTDYPHARRDGRVTRTGSRCRTCTNAVKRKYIAPPPPPMTHADPWARDLYLQALRAFDLARTRVTEEDYA